MKISQKLLTGYLVVALLTGVVGYVSVRLTHTFNQSFLDLSEDELPISDALHELKFSGMRIISSSNEYAFLVKTRKGSVATARHEEEKGGELGLVESGIEQYRAAFERYDHLVRTQCRVPMEKTAFNGIKNSGEALIKTSRLFIDALDRGVSEQALFALKEKQEQYEREFLSAVDRDLAQEKKEFTANSELMGKAVSDDTKLVLLLALVTFLLAGVGGFLVSRSISRPILQLKNAAEKIGRGELDTIISITSADEVGELAATFNQMARGLRRSHEVIELRLRFEKVISEISSRFVGVIDIDQAINAALADIGGLNKASRSYLFLLNEDGAAFRYAYEWCADGVAPAIDLSPELPVDAFPWWVRKLSDLEVINVSNVSAMPLEAENEKQELTRQGVKAVLVLPVVEDRALIGFVGFDNVSDAWEWNDNDLMLLRMFSEIIANALARRKAENKLLQYAEEVKAANEEQRAFVYIVSHDLRAPLVSIKGFSHELRESMNEVDGLLEKHLPAMSKEDGGKHMVRLRKDIKESLDFIGSSAMRMDGLINSILTLSRMGRQELKPEPLDMHGLVTGILKSLGHQIEQGRVKIIVQPLPGITADKLSLEQIMGNLIDNALKYLDPSRPGEIEVAGSVRNGEAVFHIRDNGRGMAKEDVPKAFEVFRRVGKQDTQGEGMGLAYVKTLVKRMNGRIWCESEPGAGSTFSFALPVSAALKATAGNE